MKDRKQFHDHPVMSLIRKLTTFRVDWSHVVMPGRSPRDIPDYEPGIDIREEELDHANVVSSLRLDGSDFEEPYHAVALDLDIPAYLVPSSTPGHSHLYIDAKVPHHRYMALLSALADAGVIERGYADVSIKRGRSDLRLPWVEKGDRAPAARRVPPEPPPVTQSDFF